MTTPTPPLAVLAFSGGLDTSWCVLELRRRGYRVHAVSVDCGGCDAAERARIAARAERLGASHEWIDAREELVARFLRHLIAGHALRGGVYPLVVSAERVCQAAAVARRGRTLGAALLAHGSTGAGNDQLRFDVAFAALAPEIPSLAPVRATGIGRAEEEAALVAAGLPADAFARTYSVNRGLWGGTVGGGATHDPWASPPETLYRHGTIDPGLSPRTLVLHLTAGLPSGLDGEELSALTILERLDDIGARYGLGRGVHLGETVLGIKGRVVFEAPAALLVLTAHRELSKLVTSQAALFWNDHLGQLYGSLVHEGRYFDPLARDLEAFFRSFSRRVTGDVRLSLRPGAFGVEGVRSPHALLDAGRARYGESSSLWDGRDAEGFCRVTQAAARLYAGTGEEASPC
jgi:argininosuccinate synthase